MKLKVDNLTLVIDTAVVNDPEPVTEADRIAWVQDAVSEANARLREAGTGIRIEGPASLAFIRSED